MSKLFQPNNLHVSSSIQDQNQSFQLSQCYQQIATLKDQLSSVGIQHLLKIRQLQQDIQKSKYQIESIGGIRQILENQIEQMGKELQEQYRHNKQIEQELVRWREEKERETEVNRSRSDFTQEEVSGLNQKLQLLELKNQGFIEENQKIIVEIERMRVKHVEDGNRYEIRIHELSSIVERLNMEGDSMSIIRNQNSILHKELELKICEVEELTRRLLEYEKEEEQKNERIIGGLDKENVEQYLQEAILQIEQLRKQNQFLKQQQPIEKNLKALKTELISIKSQYSTSLRQNNYLIEQNAKLEKQKSIMSTQLQKHRKGDIAKKQKAYITICEEKNQMQIQLMNTYEQIEKFNHLLMKKDEEIQSLMNGGGKQKSYSSTVGGLSPQTVAKKKDIFVNQGYGVKLVMQKAEQLNHNHWDNIETKIQMLKSENEALKSRTMQPSYYR